MLFCNTSDFVNAVFYIETKPAFFEKRMESYGLGKTISTLYGRMAFFCDCDSVDETSRSYPTLAHSKARIEKNNLFLLMIWLLPIHKNYHYRAIKATVC